MQRTITSLTLACCSLTAISASGATVAYWRFEDNPGFISDSSPSGLTLTNSGSVTQVATPFPSTIPQTGAGNAKAASFSGSNNFTVADNAAFDFSANDELTAEVFFRAANVTGTSILASQFAATVDQRSWFFGIADGQLRFAPSATGGTTASGSTRTSAFSTPIALNNDYYAAVTYNDGAVTFYLKNLTAGGSLLSDSQISAVTELFNSTAALQVGAAVDTSTGAGDSRNNFTGTLDEVRLSNSALGSNQLLISVPEPSALALLGGLAWPAMSRRRGR